MLNFDSLLHSQLSGYYGWMIEHDLIPEIVIDTAVPGVQLPPHLMATPHVILNISMTAADRLSFNSDELTFNARFSQRSFAIKIPYRAVLSITSRSLNPQFNLPMLPVTAMESAYNAVSSAALSPKSPLKPALRDVNEQPVEAPKAADPQTASDPAPPTPAPTSGEEKRAGAVVLQGRFGEPRKSK